MSKKTNILLGFLSLMLLLPLTVKAQPKYEVRAAWVTTAYGLDWPRTRATSPATMKRQQQELIQAMTLWLSPSKSATSAVWSVMPGW